MITGLVELFGYEILVTFGEAEAEEFGEPDELVVEPFRIPKLLP